MKNVGNSSRGRSQGVQKIQGPMYMAHRAVIFATAQLSCKDFPENQLAEFCALVTIGNANYEHVFLDHW